MHALKPSYLPPQPTRRTRTVPRHRSPQRQRPHRAIVVETTVKLSVNVVLSIAAIGALVQLLPYRSSQQAKLQELQTAVQSMSDRVHRVQNNFSQYFDPYQAEANMAAQSNRIGAQQRRVVLQDRNMH